MKRTVRRSLGFAVVALVVAAFAVPKLISFDSHPAADASPSRDPGEAARALQVSSHRVEPQRLVERLATTGTLRANERLDVVSEVAGKVAEIHFREATPVGAGQLLVKIDDSELRAEAERVHYRLELAEQRERRRKELLDEGVTSQDDYDLALNELNVLRAERRVIEAQLAKTEIRAPFAGVVGLRAVSLGSYLSPQTRITTLQDVDPIKIDFSVPERYAPQVEVGGEIRFRTKGSDELHRGTIYAVEPSVDAETRSLVLRARSPNPGQHLIPGAFADVEWVVREVEGALAVPSIAVIPELGGKKVFVVEDGRAQPRQVETGMRTESMVEVVEGLEAGEVVITSGLLQIRPGLEVEAGGPGLESLPAAGEAAREIAP